MFEAVDHPYRVPYDGSTELAALSTTPPTDAPEKKALKDRLKDVRQEVAELQRAMYAQDQWSLLVVFQALDAAGKDGTIRHVFRGVNPAGCQVFSFKKPSAEELDHDFLWRTTNRLPERGRIGVFNRSYYEEVLVVRVHPELLRYQRLPRVDLETIWSERFDSIRDFERHLARNGTAVVKFFLNVGKDEQLERFRARIDEPEKNWKFSDADVKERGFWDQYQHAFEQTLRQTSRSCAPWYAIPADDKHYMRLTVAEILRDTLRSIDPRYPDVGPERVAELQRMRDELV